MIPLLYGLVCLIWGSTWLAIKFGLEGVPPFLGAGLRFTLAAAILWALVFFAGLSPRLTPRGRRAAIIAGILGFGIGYSLVYWAETRVASDDRRAASAGRQARGEAREKHEGPEDRGREGEA